MRGECLCGRVRFEFTGFREGVRLCHCSVCRRITGAAHGATVIADSEGFRWTSGRELVRTFSRPPGLRVSFCGECGSHVPDVEPCPIGVPVPAGTLEDSAELRVIEHIHVKSRAAWDEIGGSAPRHDEDGP